MKYSGDGIADWKDIYTSRRRLEIEPSGQAAVWGDV
jgi:hypothetical protein